MGKGLLCCHVPCAAVAPVSTCPLHSPTCFGCFFPHLSEQTNQLLLWLEWHVRADNEHPDFHRVLLLPLAKWGWLEVAEGTPRPLRCHLPNFWFLLRSVKVLGILLKWSKEFLT